MLFGLIAPLAVLICSSAAAPIEKREEQSNVQIDAGKSDFQIVSGKSPTNSFPLITLSQTSQRWPDLDFVDDEP